MSDAVTLIEAEFDRLVRQRDEARDEVRRLRLWLEVCAVTSADADRALAGEAIARCVSCGGLHPGFDCDEVGS